MKIISISKYVFTIVGLGLLIGSFFLYKNTQEYLIDAVIANGTVTDLVRSRSSDSTTYRPVVEFMTQDGVMVEFTSSSGSNPPSYSKGEVIEVLYQEFSPEKAKINSFFSLWGGPVILGAMGSIFFLIGFVIILFGLSRSKKIAYLQRHGIPVMGKFQSVEINSALEVNGKNPYRIHVQWINPATSELHLFESEDIWFDPTDHINNEEITVLIEHDNPAKYYVDISFLPKVASRA